MRTFVAGAFAILVMVLLMKYGLTEDARRAVWKVICGAAGAAAVAGTAWAFVAARRRSLVDGVTTLAAAAMWAAGCTLGVMMLPMTQESPLVAYLLGAGFLALAVAPLAAAPLAVAWNRHR
jgi:hypothetical protein